MNWMRWDAKVRARGEKGSAGRECLFFGAINTWDCGDSGWGRMRGGMGGYEVHTMVHTMN